MVSGTRDNDRRNAAQNMTTANAMTVEHGARQNPGRAVNASPYDDVISGQVAFGADSSRLTQRQSTYVCVMCTAETQHGNVQLMYAFVLSANTFIAFRGSYRVVFVSTASGLWHC